MKNNQDKLFINLFGINEKKITSHVILTPILGIGGWRKYFESIEYEFSSKYYFSGIIGKYKNKKITLLYTGPGIQKVGDAVYFLRNTKCKDILFVGSVAGISDVSIGDIIMADKVFGQDGYEITKEKEKIIGEKFKLSIKKIRNILEHIKIKYTKANIASVAGFSMESKEVLNILKKEKADCIDFESLTFVKTAKEYKINSFLLYFVYDLPNNVFFYEKSPGVDDKRLKAMDELKKLSLDVITRI